MSFDFDALQMMLLKWPSREYWPDKEELDDNLLNRICQVLDTANNERESREWQADLQTLLRHALLRESKRAQQKVSLSVPTSTGWPTLNSWKEYGFRGIVNSSSKFLLTAEDWHPDWLDSNGEGVFSDAFSDTLVRFEERCPIDPFIGDVTGFKECELRIKNYE